MSTYDERQKWFEERIGKRVYRPKTTCECSVCENVYQKGLIINDKMHAIYLCDIEAEYNAEQKDFIYSDTPI